MQQRAEIHFEWIQAQFSWSAFVVTNSVNKAKGKDETKPENTNPLSWRARRSIIAWGALRTKIKKLKW